MDEKQLEQLSSSSGIPLELLSRSIQARAESSGVTPADILNSWSGGEAIDPIPASKEEVNVVEEATRLRKQMRSAESLSLAKQKKYVKRLKVLNAFLDTRIDEETNELITKKKPNHDPEWMMLDIIPVIPPKLELIFFTTFESDLNSVTSQEKYFALLPVDSIAFSVKCISTDL